MDLLDTYARPVSQRILLTIDRWYRSGDQPSPDPGALWRTPESPSSSGGIPGRDSLLAPLQLGRRMLPDPLTPLRIAKHLARAGRRAVELGPALTQPVPERRYDAGGRPSRTHRSRPGEHLTAARRLRPGARREAGAGSCGCARRVRWAAHDVRFHRTGTKRIHHPVVGELDSRYESLELSADDGLSVAIFTAEPGSASQQGLDLLASWTATPRAPHPGSPSGVARLGFVVQPDSPSSPRRSSRGSPSSARSAPPRSVTCSIASATARYPFIAILEGEVAILDAAGHEIVRHGPSRLPRRDEPPLGPDRVRDRGRHAAAALHRGRARRAARAAVRGRAAERPPPRRPSSRGARRCSRSRASGSRSSARASSEPTMRMLDFARSNRLPFTWHGRRPAGRRGERCRSSACRAAPSCGRPSTGEVSRALGIGRELARAGGGRPRRRRRRARRPRRRRVRRVRGTRDARRREHRARRPGRLVPPDRELPRLPGRDHGTELTSRAVTQARKFDARTATPVPRRLARAGRRTATSCASRRATRSPRAPCCSRPAPSTGACRSTASPSTRG